MRSKILVVEDEAAINDLICLSLETAGYETVSFRDGGKAGVFLEDCHAEDCDLALLDIMLREGMGLNFCPSADREKVPVIFLTAKGVDKQ
mgnify:CR=1 FL=1